MAEMRRILFVEDDAMTLSIYRNWLRKWLLPSCAVMAQFACSGIEAEQFLNGGEFDVTFLDLAIPGKSGLELLREHRDKMGALVIASSYPEMVKRILDSGYNVLVKPFSELDFVESLSSVLNGGAADVVKSTVGELEGYQII